MILFALAALGLPTGASGQVTSCSDPFEPNDTRGLAHFLDHGSGIEAEICDDDEDWFVVATTPGESVQVSMIIFTNQDLDLQLVDSDGAVLATSTSTTPRESATATMPADGAMYVHVYGFDGATSPYSLRAHDPCQPDAYEPNDTREQAAPIPLSEPITATGCPLDLDWYAIDVQAGDRIFLTADASADDLPYVMYEPGGSPIAEADLSVDEPSHQYASTTGTYTIGIFAVEPAPYEFEVTTGAPCVDDPLEQNDSPSERTPLPPGQTLLAVTCSPDPDFFATPVQEGEGVVVVVSFVDDEEHGLLIPSLDSGQPIPHMVRDRFVAVKPESDTVLQSLVYYVGAVGESGYAILPQTPCTPPAMGAAPDVGPTHLFCFDVVWLTLTGITTGTVGGTFEPARPVTRGSIAAFLRRFADYSDDTSTPAFTPPTAPTFPDVGPEHPFFDDVEELVALGVISGRDDGTYDPGAAIKRGPMAALLHRLVTETAGVDDFEPPDTATFVDVPTDHPFYRSIEWLAAQGIATGDADGRFEPSAPITRGAYAALQHRLNSWLRARL